MKKIIAAVISFVLFTVNLNIIYAKNVDLSSQFLGKEYIAAAYDVDENVPVESCTILDLNDGFVGKTYVSTSVMYDKLVSEYRIELGNSQNTMIGISLKPNGEQADICINGETKGSVKRGLWIDIQLMYDTSESKFGIVISDYGEVLIDGEIYTDGEMPLSKIYVDSSNENTVYNKSFTVKRSVISADGSSVLAKCGKYITAFATADKNDYVYLAHMRRGALIEVTAAQNKTGSSYCEAFMENKYIQGDSYHIFVWNSSLTPVQIAEKINSEEFEKTKYSASGSIEVSGQVCKEETVFIASLEDDTADMVIQISRDGTDVAELNNGECKYTFSQSGTYVVCLYAKYGKSLVPAAKQTFYVYPKPETSDSFIFIPEKNYYVKNGARIYFDDGYIPLVSNGKVYLAQQFLKSIFGLEISGNNILLNGKYLTSSVNIPQKESVYSAGDICSAAGYIISEKNGLACISKDADINVSEYEDVIYDYCVKSSFENVQKAWDGKYYPENWGFYDWSAAENDDLFAADYTDKTDGENSIYIAAVQKMFAGMIYNIELEKKDLNKYIYSCTIDTKTDIDTENIAPYAALLLKKDNNFVSIAEGTGVEAEKGKWKTVTSYFTSEAINQCDFDTANLIIGVKNTKENSASGKIYFDNVKLKEESILSDCTEAEIKCKDFASWYNMGDTVTYISENKLDEFKEIKGIVYDIDNNIVAEKTISIRDFLQNGWTHIPQRTGYYEVEFYGLRTDKSESPIVNAYTKADGYEYSAYTLLRHSFAVVKGAAKPMEKRSDLLMLCDDSINEDMLKLGNLIGFSGIRYGVSWGNNVVNKGFHVGENSFDWQRTDSQINIINKYGFKNAIACVLNTPVWAARSDIGNEYNIVGNYYANCSMPTKLSYITEGFGAFTERYADDLSGIEVWNEPYFNKYAYWHDGAENFELLTQTAYEAIKNIAPDMTVYSAGFNQGESFFEELMKNENYRKSFDAISYHGRYNDAEGYEQILARYGMNDIPLINSEGYYYANYKKGTPKDYAANNMEFYMHYLEQIKLGVKAITLFEICDLTPDEYRVSGKGSHTMGLFRQYPYIEPNQGAVVAYNFFDNLGNEVSYFGEYDFGDGRKAVAIDSDGEKQIYIWSAKETDFNCPEELIDCIGDNGYIVDFEGNNVDTHNFKANKMYCIRHADAEKLKLIPVWDNTALNPDYAAPYYTCKNEFGEEMEEYVPMTGRFTEGKLFDTESFESESEILFNSESVWYGANGQEATAEYALSFDDSGMYLTVNVDDDNYCADATTPEQITDYDSIRFALDCYGKLRSKDRSEFSVGKVNGKTTVYKIFAADRYATAPDNWNDGGTVLSDAKADISRNDSKIVYKVFLPYSELYPFNYAAGDHKMVRFALAVGDNNSGKRGDICFGEGLVGNSAVWKYAKVSIAALSLDIKQETGSINISGCVFDNSKRVMINVMREGELVNFIQSDNLINDEYAYSMPIDKAGTYVVTVVSENGGKHTKEITEKNKVTIEAVLGEEYAGCDVAIAVLSDELDGMPDKNMIKHIEQLKADGTGNIRYTFITKKNLSGDIMHLKYSNTVLTAVLQNSTQLGDVGKVVIEKNSETN